MEGHNDKDCREYGNDYFHIFIISCFAVPDYSYKIDMITGSLFQILKLQTLESKGPSRHGRNATHLVLGMQPLALRASCEKWQQKKADHMAKLRTNDGSVSVEEKNRISFQMQIDDDNYNKLQAKAKAILDVVVEFKKSPEYGDMPTGAEVARAENEDRQAKMDEFVEEPVKTKDSIDIKEKQDDIKSHQNNQVDVKEPVKTDDELERIDVST